MGLNSLNPGANQQISPGTLVLSQGNEPNRLIILHSGTLTFRACPEEDEPNLANSRYVISMQAPAIIGANSLILNEPAAYFAAAESACVVSVYPSNLENILKIIQSKPKIAILILRSMLKQCRASYKKLDEAESLIESIANTSQSLSMAVSKIVPEQFSNTGEFTDPVIQHAQDVVKRYTQMGLNIPDQIELPFLKGNFTEMLGSGFEHNSSIEFEDLDYLEALSMLDPAILGAIAQKNPKFILQTGRKLANQFIAILNEIMDVSNKMKGYCDDIYVGDYCWLEKISVQAEIAQSKGSDTANLVNTAHFFIEEAKNIVNEYERLWTLSDYSTQTPSFRKIEQYVMVKEKEAAQFVTEEFDTGGGANVSELGGGELSGALNNSLNQILEYAQLDPQKKEEFTRLIGQIKEFSNPLDSEGEPRKARRLITPLYWEIFERCFLVYLSNPAGLIRPVELMFLTGFVDETLLTEEQVNFLSSSMFREQSKYPIHDPIDWLTLIYQKQVPTSINDLGLTFFEVLRQENKDSNWKRETDMPASVNTGEARLHFEIQNSFSATAKLTSGSIMTHLPILTQFHFSQSPDRSLMGKKRLEEQLDKILSIDFGAFHREVLYDNDDIGIKREFIQVQVIPNFILVPSIGTVFQFWEEREGNNRASRGRIMAPYLVSEDPYDLMVSATGAYRWEIVKTTLGPDWNNITSNSITADYTDYVQFFKKNRDLSPEVKEKLSTEFKRFRDDRSRFINDYSNWLKFESEGIQKLNKVARKIMAKHIPFTSTIRENLLKQPNFQEILTKAINLRKRKAIELEPRYKKYRNSNGGILPEELENTLKFFNLEY